MTGEADISTPAVCAGSIIDLRPTPGFHAVMALLLNPPFHVVDVPAFGLTRDGEWVLVEMDTLDENGDPTNKSIFRPLVGTFLWTGFGLPSDDEWQKIGETSRRLARERLEAIAESRRSKKGIGDVR